MKIVVVGNGITGVTAARRLRTLQPDWHITLVSGESTYHYSRPALMYIFMGHMSYDATKPFEDDFWRDQRLELLRAWVTEIDIDNKQLIFHDKDPLLYDRLLIATGAKSNKFGWPGQDLEGVQGLYNLKDLRKLYKNVEQVEHAVIVGGGLIGIELAEMLKSRHIEVTFLIREESYWNNILPSEESRMVSQLIKEQRIKLITETNLKEIVDDGVGRAKAIITEFDKQIDCQLVGLTVGVSPNTDLVRSTRIKAKRGILVDSSFRTNIPDIYAAGDCAEIIGQNPGTNLIQQIWYTGKRQGAFVGEILAGKDKKYDPGIWYNSAKFFDLEYQAYGMVSSSPKVGEHHIYWEHPSRRHSVRIVAVDGYVKAFNFMGIRARQEVCERWIIEKQRLTYVLDHFEEVNFDPEFFIRYEPEIVCSLKEQLV